MEIEPNSPHIETKTYPIFISIMNIEINNLDPTNYHRSAWRNRGGTSVDIIEQTELEDEIWSFSRCEIAVAGPYSDYTGNDRAQFCFRGKGMYLNTDEGLIDMDNHRVYSFPGEFKVSSRLDEGSVEVVNLIGKRSKVAINLQTISESDKTAVCLGIGTHIVFAPAMAVHVELVVCDAGGDSIRHDKVIDTDHGIWFEIQSGAKATVSCMQGQLCTIASVTRKAVA